MKSIIYLMLSSATPVFAFTLGSTNSNLQGWDTKKLEYRVNPTNCPSHVAGALDKALKLWNSAPTSNLRLSRGADSSATAASNPPVLVCSTTFGADTGAPVNSVPGAGSFGISGDRIVSGILTLNAEAGAGANISNFTETQLAIIIAHELGHVFGLGHSEEQSALMYYNASTKETFALHQDDIDGITYLYPRDEFKDGIMGCASAVGTTPPNVPPTATLAILLLPLLVLLAIRKQSKARSYGRI